MAYCAPTSRFRDLRTAVGCAKRTTVRLYDRYEIGKDVAGRIAACPLGTLRGLGHCLGNAPSTTRDQRRTDDARDEARARARAYGALVVGEWLVRVGELVVASPNRRPGRANGRDGRGPASASSWGIRLEEISAEDPAVVVRPGGGAWRPAELPFSDFVWRAAMYASALDGASGWTSGSALDNTTQGALASSGPSCGMWGDHANFFFSDRAVIVVVSEREPTVEVFVNARDEAYREQLVERLGLEE